MFKNTSKYIWFSFLPISVLGIWALGSFALGNMSTWYLLATFGWWALVSGLGVACGYHRVFSHKTHDLPVWKENVILFLAVFAGQGSSITWTALHRGLHHRGTDTKSDIHSPVAYSVFHSFVGWTALVTENNNPIALKYAVDLIRKRNHVWFHENHFKILYGVYALVAGVNLDLFAALILASFIGLMQDNIVNVLGHRKGGIGYRNFDTKDMSQNNVILGWFGWGQGWHNNHHYDPKSFGTGTDISGKWWEFDPCCIFKFFIGQPR